MLTFQENYQKRLISVLTKKFSIAILVVVCDVITLMFFKSGTCKLLVTC